MSGNIRPQSSQLAEPLWTDLGLKKKERKKSGIGVRRANLHLKKKKMKAQAGNESPNLLPKFSLARKKPPSKQASKQASGRFFVLTAHCCFVVVGHCRPATGRDRPSSQHQDFPYRLHPLPHLLFELLAFCLRRHHLQQKGECGHGVFLHFQQKDDCGCSVSISSSADR